MAIKLKNILMVLMCLVLIFPFVNGAVYGITNDVDTASAEELEKIELPVTSELTSEELENMGLSTTSEPTFICDNHREDISKSGSTMRLFCGHDGYAWKHIWMKHLWGTHKERGSLFRSPYWTHWGMLQIAMEVINLQDTLVRDSQNPLKGTKTAWSTRNNSYVKVVIQEAGTYNNQGKMNWNIITVYPIY